MLSKLIHTLFLRRTRTPGSHKLYLLLVTKDSRTDFLKIIILFKTWISLDNLALFQRQSAFLNGSDWFLRSIFYNQSPILWERWLVTSSQNLPPRRIQNNSFLLYNYSTEQLLVETRCNERKLYTKNRKPERWGVDWQRRPRATPRWSHLVWENENIFREMD